MVSLGLCRGFLVSAESIDMNVCMYGNRDVARCKYWKNNTWNPLVDVTPRTGWTTYIIVFLGFCVPCVHFSCIELCVQGAVIVWVNTEHTLTDNLSVYSMHIFKERAPWQTLYLFYLCSISYPMIVWTIDILTLSQRRTESTHVIICSSME